MMTQIAYQLSLTIESLLKKYLNIIFLFIKRGIFISKFNKSVTPFLPENLVSSLIEQAKSEGIIAPIDNNKKGIHFYLCLRVKSLYLKKMYQKVSLALIF